MEITFEEPIDEGRIVRKGIDVSHLIIYPEQSIVINNIDNSSKTISIENLSAESKSAYAAFMGAIVADIKIQYIKE